MRVVRIFLMALLSLLFLACSSHKSGKKIGFLIRSYTIDRCARERDFFVEKIKQLGAEPVIADANNDDKVQINQAVEMMDRGVSVLVIFPVNSVTAASIIREANKRNVKTIAYEIMIMNCELDYLVTADNGKGGSLMAEYMIKTVPNGDYVLLGGDRADRNAIIIKEAQSKVLEPYVKNGAIKIVYDVYSDWNAEEGYYQTNMILNLYGKAPAVIIASNDGLATGVIKALQEHGLAGNVQVTGLDAELTALQRVANGTQTLTIFKSFKKEAYAAAELAFQLVNGKNPDNISNTTPNGKINVPTILIDPELVTKENLKQIIAIDGIYKEKDVFVQ